MNRGIPGLLILLVCAMMVCETAAGELVHVPYGTAVAIDGTIGAEEWAGAHHIELTRSTELLLKHDGDWLYAGVRTGELGMFVGNICVIRNMCLHIHHSSAALGTATYRWGRSTPLWILARPFDWRCRTLGFSSFAVRERERFLAEEGWVASISYLGRPAEMEFQIAASDRSLLVWLVLLPASGADLLDWPEIQDQETFPGPIPDEFHLELGSWARLILDAAPLTAQEHAHSE